MRGRIVKKTVPKTTNNITKGIINFLQIQGHSASRVNVQGQYDEALQQWRKSGSRNGYYDISVCLHTRSGIGLFHVIDVKNEGDKMRADQITFKKEVEAAGGITFEASDLEHYKQWYFSFLKPNYIDAK
jgi:hypothetical protein